MKLRDFAEQRGVKPDTIAAYIRKHSEIQGHCHQEGKEKILDEVAVTLLSQKYPAPPPVEVVRDYETLEKYTQALEANNQLIQKIAQDAPKLAAYEMLQLQLDQASSEKAELEEKNRLLQIDADRQREKAAAEIDSKEREIREKDLRVEELEKELERANQELEKERNKGFLARLFGR